MSYNPSVNPSISIYGFIGILLLVGVIMIVHHMYLHRTDSKINSVVDNS